jgi:hypothetical protein
MALVLKRSAGVRVYVGAHCVVLVEAVLPPFVLLRVWDAGRERGAYGRFGDLVEIAAGVSIALKAAPNNPRKVNLAFVGADGLQIMRDDNAGDEYRRAVEAAAGAERVR